MAELRSISPTIVAVLASSDACDRVEAPEGTTAMRIAPRELWLVGLADPDAVRTGVDEPGALVEDVSDAWTAFELEGDDVRELVERVSELELPDAGWIQGEVARAGAKLIVRPAAVTVLVPAMLGAHIEQRIRIDAAELLAP